MTEWKKNIRKIPREIRTKLRRLNDSPVIAAVVKKISLSRISSGAYKHLGIAESDGNLILPSFIVPPASQGRFSERNVEGWEVKRDDLPMISKTFSVESPNWGDWSNGTHEVEWSRFVYQREFHAPRLLAIQMELLGTESIVGPRFIIKFQVADTLNQSHPEFEDLLLFNLNLLQENVGACDVFKADADLPDFLQTITVEWEILPPGDRTGNLARILSGRPPDATSQEVTERYDTLASLSPLCFIHGRSGFRRYFGAKFADDLVVFENIEYGNAAYVMFERWETLSKKSRLELLAGPSDGFVRVIHRSGWQLQLRNIIQQFQETHRNKP